MLHPHVIRKLRIVKLDDEDIFVSIVRPHENITVKQEDLASFEQFNQKCAEQLGFTFEDVDEETWCKMVERRARAAK